MGIKIPAQKPRYLMGVGKPEDIVEAVAPRYWYVWLCDAHTNRSPMVTYCHRRLSLKFRNAGT